MMKNRRTSSAWSIRITHGGVAWLKQRAAQLSLSAAEYSRRMLFLEAWQGVVFDDCREIEQKAGSSGPIEAYLPLKKLVIERLREGKAEVAQLKAFVENAILPALDQADAKIDAVLAMQEAEFSQMRSVDEMCRIIGEVARAVDEREGGGYAARMDRGLGAADAGGEAPTP
jgi:hypothetical protein